MWDGPVADAPTKLLNTDLTKREHFDAEHNVATGIFHMTSNFTSNQWISLTLSSSNDDRVTIFENERIL